MTQPRDIPGAKVMSWNDFSCGAVGAALDFHDSLHHEQPGAGLRQWKPDMSRSYTPSVTTAAHSLAGDPFSGRPASLNTHGMHHAQALKHRLHGESPPGSRRTWDVVAALAQRRQVQRPTQAGASDEPFSSSPLSDSSVPDVPPAPPGVEVDTAPRRRSMDQVVRIMSASPYP